MSQAYDLNTQAIMALRSGDRRRTAELLRAAVELEPADPHLRTNLGMALEYVGRLDEAVVCHLEVLKRWPEDTEAHTLLGTALAKLGETRRAEESYRNALRLDPEKPEAHYSLAHLLLAQGKFAEGWRELEWRWGCRGFEKRSFEQPVWRGEPLRRGTLLIHAEQGLGDTIQFVRFAALAKTRVKQVWLECAGCVAGLLDRSSGIDRVFIRGMKLPAYDAHLPLMSLPRVFGTTLTSIPHRVPYVHPDLMRVERWRRRFDAESGLKVGIVWQGKPTHYMDEHRSIPLAAFGPLCDVPGVRLISLQQCAGTEQIPRCVETVPVLDAGSLLIDDFEEAAASMAALDLVITVDTAAAHLAGALGLPVWTLLPKTSDWRWLRDREDTPWYPTMRLFRQQRAGDWDGVFTRVAGALRDHVEEARRRPPRKG